MFGRIFLGFAALLAVAVARVQPSRVPGAERRTVTRVTFDNNYPTGGEAVTAEDLGLQRVTFAQSEVVHGTESAELRVANADYDVETEKLKLFDNATGKELANTKDASKVVVQVVAYGS
jgi:hypothetical protein